MSGRERIPKTIRQYELQNVIGRGSFSVVFKTLNVLNQKIYACKVFSRSQITEKSDLDRFQREINAMAYIRHENIVTLHDFLWDEHNFYLIMDFCPGGELYQYMIQHGKLSEPDAALIFRQFASAIACCHSYGVAHRDLKPENILIDVFPRVKVSDFGLCGYIAKEINMQTFCGSPCYCSPECLCKVSYDGRLADVWSLGVILYTMVTGNNPWNISNTSIMIHQILKGSYTMPRYVSDQCASLIKMMLQVNPQNRYTMAQVLEHPWLRVGDESAYASMEHPPDIGGENNSCAQPIPLSIISQLSKKQSKVSHDGVFSPFEDEGIGNNQIPQRAEPRLCLKDGMLGKVRSENTLRRSAAIGQTQRIQKKANRRVMSRQNVVQLLMPNAYPTQRNNSLPKILYTFA
ncbi:CAMK family protein kinase [Histomonas meleagridis]|uniref:CAMK family protein kinase n=1 Tax=Histomonas meleagridis TaxID=135588 RepID=UPI003559C192|nr:CAMK family protein kinase [Histomonas meleagridis]KAH0801267.1 CAMK family protein kinase [Histomonas meleagridis]